MKHVVIDPSMVLKKDTLDHFEEMAPQLADFQLYFPDSFFELIEDGDLQAHFEDRISGERGVLDERNIYSFYRVSPQKATSPDRIREVVSRYKMSTEYVENSNRRPEGLDEIIDSLQRGDTVGSILAEEASFIFSGSGIISRIKKPLNKIRDAGATMVEHSKKKIEKIKNNKKAAAVKLYVAIKMVWGGSPIYIAKNATQELLDLEDILNRYDDDIDQIDADQAETAIELLSLLTEYPVFELLDP